VLDEAYSDTRDGEYERKVETGERVMLRSLATTGSALYWAIVVRSVFIVEILCGVAEIGAIEFLGCLRRALRVGRLVTSASHRQRR
jgi:hypothetical protein